MDIEKLMQTGEGIEELKQSLMGLDDTFKFKCRRCGKCCKNQHMIMFEPRDIFRIAKKLNKMPSEIINDYTEVYIGQNSRIPIVHLLMQGRKNACPFLSDEGLCTIHDVKPVICGLYPLGRVMWNENPEPQQGENLKPNVRYIFNGSCGSWKKRHTVREWLSEFGIPERDEAFFLWNEVIVKLGMMIRELEERSAPEALLQPIWNDIFANLYLNYNLKQDFMPQFKKNAEEVIQRLTNLISKFTDE